MEGARRVLLRYLPSRPAQQAPNIGIASSRDDPVFRPLRPAIARFRACPLWKSPDIMTDSTSYDR
jgi:hypothetical protein